eukprot:9234-Heterococcus_DN1.PRE.2
MSNPERVNDAGLKLRVRHSFTQCLSCFRLHPEIWHDLATFEALMGGDDITIANTLYKQEYDLVICTASANCAYTDATVADVAYCMQGQTLATATVMHYSFCESAVTVELPAHCTVNAKCCSGVRNLAVCNGADRQLSCLRTTIAASRLIDTKLGFIASLACRITSRACSKLAAPSSLLRSATAVISGLLKLRSATCPVAQNAYHIDALRHCTTVSTVYCMSARLDENSGCEATVCRRTVEHESKLLFIAAAQCSSMAFSLQRSLIESFYTPVQ